MSFTRQLVNRLTMPTRHVLVCEDDLYNQTMIANHLTVLFGPQGHVHVSFVCGGEMAAAILKDCQVDVLLLDHDMPHGNGTELLDWLKDYPEIAAGLKILTFSGIPHNNLRLMEHGAHYYCQKEDVINGAYDDMLREFLK